VIVFNSQTLFVHNPKTAGTSLIAHLQAILPGPVYVAGVNELGTHHPSLSSALAYACGVTGKSHFNVVLTVLRNPFDRELSMYRYFREVLANSPGLQSDMPDARMQRYVRKAAELEFNAYLHSLWDEEGTVDIWRSRSFYETEEGTRLDSLRVLRFEALRDDLARALGTKRRALPHLNATSKSVYNFDDKSINIVQSSYKWMFDTGWYSTKDCRYLTRQSQLLRRITARFANTWYSPCGITFRAPAIRRPEP
jgi:hypothetical protein